MLKAANSAQVLHPLNAYSVSLTTSCILLLLNVSLLVLQDTSLTLPSGLAKPVFLLIVLSANLIRISALNATLLLLIMWIAQRAATVLIHSTQVQIIA